MICPGCGHPWTKPPEEALQPEVGDVTICAGCGRILRFVRSVFAGTVRLACLSDRDERAMRKAVRERLLDLSPK